MVLDFKAVIDSEKDGFIVVDLLTYGAFPMQKTFLTAIFVAVLVLSGCAISTTTTNVFREETKFDDVKVESIAPYITSGEYVQRANNLFIIADASSSATEDYKGVGYKANNPTFQKIDVEREILHRVNRTIANSASSLNLSNFKVNLISYGYGNCDGYGSRYSDLHLDTINYSQTKLDEAIETMRCSQGRSELTHVLLDQTSKALESTTGNISLLIVADLITNDSGYPFSNFDYPLGDSEEALQALKDKYGDRLCVYNIWTGEETETAGSEKLYKYFKNLSSPSCGEPEDVTAERASSPDGMKSFMRAVLLTPVPKPAVKNTDCSTMDSDGDGVNDCDDKCPNTLKGTPVNKLGCWIVDIKFDNDSSEIKEQYFPLLDKLAIDISTNFSNLNIEVQGHTSSTASAEYNLKLSVRRATAVAEYLNKKIKGSHKLTPHGYGLTRPIDTNQTAAGRANNRRVQLEILK